jgi:hypothetical protein
MVNGEHLFAQDAKKPAPVKMALPIKENNLRRIYDKYYS